MATEHLAWTRLRERTSSLPLEKNDHETLVALLLAACGDDEQGARTADKFLTEHNDGLRGKPMEMLRSGGVVGVERVLSYLKHAWGRA
jgi:hypothetical protein